MEVVMTIQAILEMPEVEYQQKVKPCLEVADIFRQYGVEYRRKHPQPLSHLKVMHSIEVCRTAELGGHVEQCNACGFQRISYNSCRNRHCPKCQALTKAKWLEARKAELLPVGYFHLVFTLPHELNALALCNKEAICNILFKAVSETLLEFGKDPNQGLGGTVGFTALLHTWDQTIRDHFHLHVVIPGGALSFDGNQWISSRENFLFPVKALSKTFRGKFIDYLKQAFQKGELTFAGQTAHYGTEEGFSKLLDKLYERRWVVYSKESFKSAEHVLDYLGRYTHRVAISNDRILAIENGYVTFQYKDRREENHIKEMTLTTEEFIRRFLLHVLPDGFKRIRHFGFLANRCKKENIMRIRKLLGLKPEIPKIPVMTAYERMLDLTGLDLKQCPSCKQGTMVIVREIANPYRNSFRNHRMKPNFLDSS
jgi:predicted Zn-ribbon and HTH transcriptional regulator